jgi:phosphatidylinositol 4-kinase
LVSHNTILTLGHMAVALKDVQHTQQSILARFQQRLGDPPSPLDILIINQIGCMLISSLVSNFILFPCNSFGKRKKNADNQ